MAAAVMKAKSIEKVFSEAPASSSTAVIFNDDDISASWPEGENKNKHQNEEDLYGYGDGAPTPRTNGHRMPRRSSLKSDNGSVGGGASARAFRRASIGYTGEVELVLPMGKIARKRTSISFADESSVTDIESVADMVDSPKRLWFQKEEYAHIQQKIQEIVASKKNNKNSDLDIRGLENLLDDSGLLDRQEAWGTVFDEQNNQKSRGAFNDLQIKDLYEFHTIDAQVRANERAAKDSEEVKGYLKVTRRMCRRMSC